MRKYEKSINQSVIVFVSTVIKPIASLITGILMCLSLLSFHSPFGGERDLIKTFWSFHNLRIE